MIKTDGGNSVEIKGSNYELLRDYITATLALRDIFPDDLLRITVEQCLKISKDKIPKIKIDMSKIRYKG